MRFLPGIVCTLLASPAFSQAEIQGVVRDEAAVPVPFAHVRLLNSGISVRSGADGSFTLRALPPGTYTVYSSAPGYEDAYSTVIVLAGSSQVNLVQARSGRTLEAVVVTAQKREELAQQVPAAITALSAQKIEAYRLWNVSDLTAVSPNLYATHPGDYRNVTSIRGVANTSYEPAVTTYVDGVNQFNLDTYIPQLFDVERIEVLKGPQGTLYGRNAMGGVVNIVTRKPGNVTDGFAQAGVGNYGLQRHTAGIRVPLAKDKLYFGAAGLYERSNGFYTNTFNGKHYDEKSSAIGNYYLRFVPTARWSFTLNAKHAHNRNRGAFPLVADPVAAFAEPFTLSQNAVTKMIDNVFNGSLAISHTGRRLQLNAQTAYQSNRRYYTDPIDADFSPLDAVTIINNYGGDWNKVKVFTQEVNLRPAASAGGRVKWLLGSYFFRQDAPTKQATRFGEDAGALGSPDNNFSLISTSTAKSTGIAVYGEATYELSKRVALTAGLRYDHETRRQQVQGEYQKDPDPNPAFDFRPDTSAMARFTALSPRLTLSVTPAAGQLLYLTYNRGFRAGGLTSLSSDPSQPALFAFRPEFSNNVEAGWKQSLLGQRLLFNVSVFYTSINDVQVPTLVLPDAVTITRNTGKLSSKGVETELRLLLPGNLSIDHSFGYTHAEYERLKVAQNGAESDLQGKRQLFTPDVTSMLAVQFAPSTGRHSYLALRGEWKYIGTHYFDLGNNIRQEPYHLLNARLAFGYKKAELALWGRNLGDRRYIGYAYDFGAIRLGDPRTYGASLGIRF